MRVIVHLDADAFFASVEQAADSRLRGKPVAVGGERRGIIASASYEARKFGIYTPMPTSMARKLCPKLILLPGDFEKYEQFSRWMFSYAYDFTPDVEVSSIDEGYFDLTQVGKPPITIARTIREAIYQALKISVSEGIAANKLVSQIASKLHKPAAFQEVPHGGEIPFLHPLANHWLPGIGPKTASRLNAAGLALVGQVAATPVELLHLLLGSVAPTIKEFANGIDTRPVVTTTEPAKSYSQQETFDADTTDEVFIEATLRRMADQLMAKVREDAKSIRTLTVKVRYNDMAEDQCGESLPEPIDLESDIYGRLGCMLRRAWKRRVSLRLVSLRFSNVYDARFSLELPLEQASHQQQARHRLAEVIDELRQTNGRDVILRGHDLLLRERAGEQPAPPPRRPASGRRVVRTYPMPRAGGTDRATARTPSRSKPEPVIPLAVHSYYSFLDSTLSIDALIALAAEHGLPAVALADTANLHGAAEFMEKAVAAGIQPVLGATVKLEGKPLRLYVQNQAGYANLCRILSELDAARPAAADEEETRDARDAEPDDVPLPLNPTISLDHLRDAAEGLIAAGADPAWASLFPDRFYLAVDSPSAARKRAGANLPLVLAQPVHFATPEDQEKYRVLQSIRTLTLLNQEHPEKWDAAGLHLRPWRELWQDFGGYPEALSNTREIAERCSDFRFPFGKPQFPAFSPPDGSDPREYLHELVWAGARRRYGTRSATLRAQIQEELSIIAEVGYEEYFLVVWGLLQACRDRGIDWLTRGSAADSLVCYCLGISDVCPIRFDLYFRRFLNRERMQMDKLPDIDIDFPHDRKDEVIDLIFERFGTRHTAVVGGFSTYQARGAVADVAKVFGVSDHQARRFTEHFPYAGTRGLADILREHQECRDLPIAEEPFATALKMAEFLDGFPRYPKMHPCGVVVSRQPMHELTPTFRSSKGYPTTHLDMDGVEAIGLIKMDILAQGGLAVMRDVKTMLRRRGIEVDLGQFKARQIADTAESLSQTPGVKDPILAAPVPEVDPWTDPNVWEVIAGGGARAVHHIESPAMVSLCRNCNVRDIDGLVAIVSVIRPGAANEQKKAKFARRYQGIEPPEYPDPSLEPCLKSTYGLVVYEEHILQICEAFAGLPGGRADMLRRALGKHKQNVIDQIELEFRAAARARGREETVIQNVWELVNGFSGYAFCKAHSTAYGVEAYQSAWLKHYFPAEFMAAVLTNGKGFYHPIVYVLECHRLGIPLLNPSVNQPGPGFEVCPVPESYYKDGTRNSPDGGAARRPERGIRVPIGRLKGLTDATLRRTLAEFAKSPFRSMADFYRRAGPQPEDLEILIRAGAFDCFGRTRTAQFWEAQHLRRAYSGDPTGQGWLLPDSPPRSPDQVREPTRRERLLSEAELLDFPVSGHPLELHEYVAWDTYCPVSRLGDYIGQQVVACGLIIEQRTYQQATGEPMKFLTLSDWTGMVETELFAATYRSYGLATIRYPVLEVTARVEPFENERGFSLRVLRAGRPRERQTDPAD